MPGTAVVTGVIGPARTLATQTFPNLVSFSVDTTNEILTVVYGQPAITVQIDIGAATTITCTVAGNVYTLTIS